MDTSLLVFRLLASAAPLLTLSMMLSPSGTVRAQTRVPPDAAPATPVGEASGVLMMPIGGTEDLRDRLASATSELVGRQLAVDELELRPLDDWWGDVPRELQGCMAPDCAMQLRVALQAEAVLFVALWEQDAERQSVEVLWVGRQGRVAGASTFREDAGLDRALGEAFAEIRRKRAVGAGPYLSVQGTPEGAQVLVDGTAEGTLPHLMTIAPGPHQIRVRLSGYESEEMSVTVPTDPIETATLAVNLVALSDDADDDWLHVVGPLTLLAGGTAAMVVGAAGLASDPTVARSNGGGIILDQRNDAASHGWLWSGMAAAVAGGTWLALHLASDPGDAPDTRRPVDATARLVPFASPQALGVTVHAALP